MRKENPSKDDKPSHTAAVPAGGEPAIARTDGPPGRTDRVNRAMRNPYNVLALAVMVAVGAIALSVWPIIAAFVLEAAYLGAAALRQPPADASDAPKAGLSANLAHASTGRKLGASRGQPAGPPRTGIMPRKAAALRGITPVRGGTPSMKKPAGQTASELLGDGNEQRLRIEAAYRLIELQADGSNPVIKELLSQLAYLLERFVFFSETRDQFEDLLQTIAAEAKALPSAATVSWVPDLQLVYADGESECASFEARVQRWIKQAHDGFERELKEIAWNKRETRDPVLDAKCEQRAQVLLRRNRYTDKIGKTLLNLHCAIRLIEKRFDAINLELSTRSSEHVLSDVKALVLQTQSLSRSVDEFLPPEESVEYHAA
jgi:hypothetical protein